MSFRYRKMSIRTSGGKTNDLMAHHISIAKDYLGSSFVLSMIIIWSFISQSRSSNCPLLRSSTDDTGILFVNKTIIETNALIVHCQWLIVGSSYQVWKTIV